MGGRLRLEGAFSGGNNGAAIVPGKPERSPFYTLTVLPADHDDMMPPDGPPLSKSQTDLLKQWIAEGAKWPTDAQLTVQPRINFVTHIEPILEENCLACHQSTSAEGDYDLSRRATAIQRGSGAPAIIPFRPNASVLYTLTILESSDNQAMPPEENGGRHASIRLIGIYRDASVRPLTQIDQEVGLSAPKRGPTACCGRAFLLLLGFCFFQSRVFKYSCSEPCSVLFMVARQMNPAASILLAKSGLPLGTLGSLAAQRSIVTPRPSLLGFPGSRFPPVSSPPSPGTHSGETQAVACT